MKLNLFGEETATSIPEAADGGKFVNAGMTGRYGIAAQSLVLVDLLLRGHDAAVMDGMDIDVIAIIDGTIRKVQVKSSMDSLRFGPGGPWLASTGHRSLQEYKGKIDAFAFVSLAKRAIFYVHPDAVHSSHISIPNSHWGRQQCDLSFDELLKRWDCL